MIREDQKHPRNTSSFSIEEMESRVLLSATPMMGGFEANYTTELVQIESPAWAGMNDQISGEESLIEASDLQPLASSPADESENTDTSTDILTSSDDAVIGGVDLNDAVVIGDHSDTPIVLSAPDLVLRGDTIDVLSPLQLSLIHI